MKFCFAKKAEDGYADETDERITTDSMLPAQHIGEKKL